MYISDVRTTRVSDAQHGSNNQSGWIDLYETLIVAGHD